MNKKIFAAVLGGTLLAACAFSFAGCGHKHNYEIFYRVADCDSEGYTLHTCKDCGYKYADEFVAPFGHLLTYTCHIEEDETSAVKSAARGKSAASSGHYELCVPINADLLEELKEYGKSACIHKECQFCSNPAAFKYYMENYTYEQLVELSKKCISFQDGYDNMSFEEFGTLINEILLMESGFKNIDKNLYDQWEQLYGSPFSSFMPPPDAFSDAQTDEKPMVIAVDAFETGLGRIPGPKTKIECYEYDMLSHVPHGLFEYRRYPIEITMPDTIEEIENNAFGNCATLRRVDLSKNLKIVSDNAFRGAHLTSIIIPKSVKFIGRHAFGFYDKLQAVFFEGSFGDWYEGIEFEDENDGLKKAKVYLYEDNEWYYYNGEPCY